MHARDQHEGTVPAAAGVVTAAIVDFESLESRLFMRVEGVDVSLFQGAINWQTLRDNNKEFAFVRSSRTNLDLDANFHANMAGAKAAGVITGPYHRALPLGESDGGTFTDAITDARRFYNAAKDYMKEGYLRPVIDAEDGFTLGKAVLSKWINDFSVELERLSGIRPIIYANANYATNFLDTAVAARHDLWIARWNGGNANLVNPQTDQPETPAGYVNPYGSWNQPLGGPPSHNVWDFWQYTSNGNGIALGVSSSRLDLDVFNGDLETMRRLFVTGHQWNYHNTPFAVGPGILTTIQGEDYDMGGQGYAFNDTTPNWNTGGAYRTNPTHGAVDVKRIDNTTNLFRIADTRAGEWVEYTVNVAVAGNYKVDFRLSQTEANGRVRLAVNGASVGSVDVPDTNGFSVFTTRSRTIGLSAGKHVLRLAFDRAAANGSVAGVDWLKLSYAGALTSRSLTATYVRDGSFASQNFGNDEQIHVKRSANLGYTREGYIKFDLSPLTAINSAKLRLTARLSSTSNASVVTNVYSAASTSWSETSLNWNVKPAAGPTLRGSTAVTGTAYKTYEIDLTAFLKSEFAAGRKVITLVLKNPNISDALSIVASDDSTAPPLLVLA